MAGPDDVAVTGLGLVTPGGIGVEPSWAAVLSGRSRAAHDPVLADNPVSISCRVPGFDPAERLGGRKAHRLDRFVQLALVAAHEAVADAGLDTETWDGARVGVVIGSAGGGAETFEANHRVLLEENPAWVSPLLLPMHLSNMAAGQVAMEFGARGPNMVVATACASGATAIGIARDLLVMDRCDIVLAGGTEALLNPVTMAGFARMGALSKREEAGLASRPFDIDRDGFVGAEGAGMMVLERVPDAVAAGRRVRGRVLGYGATADAHHVTSPDPGGVGVQAAIQAALAEAGASARDVVHVNAHGTSTPLNDLVEAQVLARVLPNRPVVSSTKGVTGHMMGAAGAAEAVFSVLALENGLAPPTANTSRLDPRIDIDVAFEPRPVPKGIVLSNSFGFGGQNAVLAIAAA
ncbi:MULTISPECIES: beta-ketoacyl-[acyl-carrier-protein] synthase family protein [Actinokineospora]|uniref:3-oxoacyl-[acyl-carrier-protein] synthase 2 n=1 Tax=Actinokineospora fastidiosa TaxID=1816 RepID=A0A918LA17_9PSEU|nr:MULTISPECIES: beta-ketoacyl-[acyl-carrier-protein] synthase family protein [Actinokineospora]UVS82005.1 3-oxoacyl-[acyl-carrier-protein] synthase 2 [Actinokineospora sp. UTMC 2448]GGS24203.1 3-oxoacyl-[acyl-carrier-protein] synthase 2 [Actinokineospora fastidiosa]